MRASSDGTYAQPGSPYPTRTRVDTIEETRLVEVKNLRVEGCASETGWVAADEVLCSSHREVERR